ncbi:unnamed protein product [Angiostrongylus costaricensis]|uniref:Reverse transcriptase domain-containing protein n=1 Tax=Angiostrongylus costaricensis TaxID=334426 RepID=A0A0R3PI22_ANGCS|nr:unnamed protein product [Angiostrongylus costaricensis]
MFMRSGLVVYATLALNRTNIPKCFKYVNLGREINAVNDFAPELRKDNLRFADNVVLITPNISQAERMLDDFDKTCGKIGLRVNLTQTALMKDGLVSHAPFTLNGANISKCSSNIYLTPLSAIERAVERAILGVSRFTQIRDGIGSPDLHQRSKIEDEVLYAILSKVRWARHVTCMNDKRWTRAVSDWILRDVKRTAERPRTRRSVVFAPRIARRFSLLVFCLTLP